MRQGNARIIVIHPFVFGLIFSRNFQENAGLQAE